MLIKNIKSMCVCVCVRARVLQGLVGQANICLVRSVIFLVEVGDMSLFHCIYLMGLKI
jgi:hypothetical protein